MYVDVIVAADAPDLPQPFTYRVPENLADAVCEGACVAAPFAGRELIGYVVNIFESPPEDILEIKDLLAVVPDACKLTSPLIGLAGWISTNYLSPPAQTVRAIIPEVMSSSISRIIRIVDSEKVSDKSPYQKRLVEILLESGGEMNADRLKQKAKSDKFGVTLRQLRNRGAVEIVHKLELPKAKPKIVKSLELADEAELSFDGISPRAVKQAALIKELMSADGPVRQAEILKKIQSSSSPAQALVKKGLVEKKDMRVRRIPFMPSFGQTGRVVLTDEQKTALEIIDNADSSPVLIHGVTGSGKTEIYMQAIEKVLNSGGSCISMVPEISLTTYLMSAYYGRFGDQIAILHSRLSAGERHDEWRRIESGEARLVLGPRSAVFAPARNLRLIILDEEHEPSYKQDNTPRYHARAAAEQRAVLEGASVILGSATPSVESYHRALNGEYKLAVMEKRIDDRPLPEVEIVDQRIEYEKGRRSIFSEKLEAAVKDRLDKGEQVILFVNRRGYASFMLCRTCGYTPRCQNCAVSLTYHSGPKLLRCHHCNAAQSAPTVCPNCQGIHIRQFGIGTERVELETKNDFPSARVIRMDSDTTTRKGSHARLLETFSKGEADILVGTQMIAKGLDFPNVSLVGIISADTSLHMPDFRSAERTFQLLTQVSGRAGRGDIQGEVVAQTFSPEHYAIEAASNHDYVKFYKQEIAFREELRYPPFARLLNIVSSDTVNGYAEDRLKKFATCLRENISAEDVEVLGPAPSPLSKLKGRYRWHLIIKDYGMKAENEIRQALAQEISLLSNEDRSGMTFDVDPQAML